MMALACWSYQRERRERQHMAAELSEASYLLAELDAAELGHDPMS